MRSCFYRGRQPGHPFFPFPFPTQPNPFPAQPGCCSSVADTLVIGKPCASNPPRPVATHIPVHLATACGASQKVGEIPKSFDSHGHQRERKNNRLDHLYVANKLTFVAHTPNDRIMTVRLDTDTVVHRALESAVCSPDSAQSECVATVAGRGW